MPTSGGSSDNASVRAEDWDEAPCGLLLLDERGRVRAANARFLALTGYRSDDVVAKAFWNELVATGTRALYQTQLAPVLELDGALNEVMIDLRTADGQRVPALLNARRVSDGDGCEVATRIALMSVPDRRVYENELRQARRRLEFLGRATTALATGGEVQAVLGRLADVLVADFADSCLIYTPDVDDPAVGHWSAADSDPGRRALLQRLTELLPAHAGPRSALRRVLDHGQPLLLAQVNEQHQRDASDSDEVRAVLRGIGVGSAVIAPCVVRAARVAVVICVRRTGRSSFTTDDLMDLTGLAARTGMVIENLRRQEREHSNSVALQQALLTAPPRTPGLRIATRYLPATSGNEIGGDWYDAFLQPDGTPVLAIGDVIGHDIHAAAAMGHLRGVIRTVGYTTGGTPAEILTDAGAAARGLGVAVLASTVIARVETPAGCAATLRWSSAGHPPPILLTRDGPRLLDAASDRPLGLRPNLDRPRQDHHVPLATGDTLLLYTDGLVERVDEVLDAGLSRLVDLLREARGLDLEDLCDLVLSEHRDGMRDDIALLAVRLVDPGRAEAPSTSEA